MEIFCAGCGETHDIGEMEPAMRLPDPVLAVPEWEFEERVHGNDSMIVLDGKRFFVRGLVPLPVRGEEEPFNIGTWAEVSAEDFRRIHAGVPSDSDGPVTGSIVNRIPLMGDTLGVEVRFKFVSEAEVPRFTATDPGNTISQLQKEGLQYEDILEMLHVYFDISPDGEKPREERLQQAHRLASLRRFLEKSRKHFGLEVAAPDITTDLPDRVGVFMVLTGADAGRVEYLHGDSTEEMVGKADTLFAEMSVVGVKCGFGIWDLDSEQPVFSRRYDGPDEVVDSQPLPTLATITCVATLPAGVLTFVQSVEGIWTPVFATVTQIGTAEDGWLESAANHLGLVRHTVHPVVTVDEARGERMLLALGYNAWQLVGTMDYCLDQILAMDSASQYLGLPEPEAGELLQQRIEQIGIIVDEIVPALNALDDGDGDVGALLSTVQRVGAMNPSAELTAHVAGVVRQMLEDDPDLATS